jgi:integrase
MGSVYKRGAFWWVGFKVPGGGRVLRSTGIASSQPEREARKVLEQLERELTSESRRELNHQTTVAEYALTWTAHRKASKLTNAQRDYNRLKLHAFPTLGSKRVSSVSPIDVRAFVASLRAAGWASRTVLNIYGLLRRLFADAVADELILSTPCVLKRRDLPKKADKDPTWRARAVYTREEVELLLSNGAVPLDRRTTYAIAFLAGLREGEIAALKWESVDRDTKPLPRLLVSHSFTRANGYEKSTKTGQPREVPMHPTLQRVLKEWETKGFAEYFGRAPKPHDMLVPNRHGGYRTDNTFLKGLERDLQALGLRHRRLHDARRTFISLGRSDGAPDAVLKSLTHDQVGDQFDQYTTFSWETKCDAISRLQITGRAVQSSQALAAGVATQIATIEGTNVRNTQHRSGKMMDRAGLEASSIESGTSQRGESTGVRGSRGGVRVGLRAIPCSNVADEVLAELRDITSAYESSPNRRALATRLRLLLARVRR